MAPGAYFDLSARTQQQKKTSQFAVLFETVRQAAIHGGHVDMLDKLGQ
jgi:hypothetical protein